MPKVQRTVRKKKSLKSGGKNIHPCSRYYSWRMTKNSRQQKRLRRLLKETSRRVFLNRKNTGIAAEEHHNSQALIATTVHHVASGAVPDAELTFEHLICTKEETDVVLGVARKDPQFEQNLNAYPPESREASEDESNTKVKSNSTGNHAKLSDFRVPKRVPNFSRCGNSNYQSITQPSSTQAKEDCLSIMAPADTANFFKAFTDPKPSTNTLETITNASGDQNMTEELKQQNLPKDSSIMQDNPPTQSCCYGSLSLGEHAVPPENVSSISVFRPNTKILTNDDRALIRFNTFCSDKNWTDSWKLYSAFKSKLNTETKLQMLFKLIGASLDTKREKSFELVKDLRLACSDWIALQNDKLIYKLLHASINLKPRHKDLRKQYIEYFCGGSKSPRQWEVEQCLHRLKRLNDQQCFWLLLTLYVKWKLPLKASTFSFAVKFLGDDNEQVHTMVKALLDMPSKEIKRIFEDNVNCFMLNVDKYCDFDSRISVLTKLAEHGFKTAIANQFWSRFVTDDGVDVEYLNSLAQFVLVNSALAGETFQKLVMFLKKKLSYVFPVRLKRFISQVGVIVFLECYTVSNIYQAYKVLQILHQEQMNYLELQDVTAHEQPDLISGKYLALVAVDVALKMNSLTSAYFIFQSIDWARPCCHDARHRDEGLWRLNLLKTLFNKFFDGPQLFYIKVVFNELLKSYTGDFALLGQDYFTALNLRKLFDDTVYEFVRRRDAENALYFVARGNTISLHLSAAVHRSLIVLLHQLNWINEVREQYELCQQRNIYPTPEVDNDCKVSLMTCYTAEEINLILDCYLVQLKMLHREHSEKNLCIHVNVSLPDFLGVAVDFESFYQRFKTALETLPQLYKSFLQDGKLYVQSL